MILEIDVQGAIAVKRQIPDAFAIFIMPPNETVLLDRLKARKREDESQIAKRFAAAKAEIEAARQSGVYDVFIVNDKVDQAIQRAVDLVNAERARRKK